MIKTVSLWVSVFSMVGSNPSNHGLKSHGLDWIGSRFLDDLRYPYGWFKIIGDPWFIVWFIAPSKRKPPLKHR